MYKEMFDMRKNLLYLIMLFAVSVSSVKAEESFDKEYQSKMKIIRFLESFDTGNDDVKYNELLSSYFIEEMNYKGCSIGFMERITDCYFYQNFSLDTDVDVTALKKIDREYELRGYLDGTIRVHNIKENKSEHIFMHHYDSPVNFFTFMPQGELVVGYKNNVIEILFKREKEFFSGGLVFGPQ